MDWERSLCKYYPMFVGFFFHQGSKKLRHAQTYAVKDVISLRLVAHLSYFINKEGLILLTELLV